MDSDQKFACLLSGFMGGCFLFVGVAFLLTGRVKLRRYEGLIETDWPFALFLIVCGFVCLGGSLYTYLRSK